MFRCWGSNSSGELDIPATTQKSYVLFASLGRNYLCLIYNNLINEATEHEEELGDLVCYGNNEFNQLNVPTTLTRTNVDLLSSGDWHNCAKGKVLTICWGLNDHGQLDIPPEMAHDVHSLTARNYSTCILADHLVCFGKFKYEYKDETIVSGSYPFVGLGYEHVCFAFKIVRCVGDNEYGQLDILPESGEMWLTSTYGNHNCSVYVMENGSTSVVCWGQNDEGQNDLSVIGNEYYAISSVGEKHSCFLKGYNNVKCIGTSKYKLNETPDYLKNAVYAIATGGKFSCYIVGGEMKCFGKNEDRLNKIPDSFKSISLDMAAGYSHICASYTKLSESSVYSCWGLKKKENPEITPPDIVAFGLWTNINIQAGYRFSCTAAVSMITEHSRALCWGLNDHGQLDVPPVKQDLGYNYVSTGSSHACATTENDELTCWGRNDKGQATVPANMDHNIQSVDCGYWHTCSVSNVNYGECWGHNNKGQTDIPHILKYKIRLVYAGGDFSCGVMGVSHKTMCWGGGFEQTKVPRALTSGSFWVRWVVTMTLGHDHACANNLDGQVLCWGDDYYGQVSGIHN